MLVAAIALSALFGSLGVGQPSQAGAPAMVGGTAVTTAR
jgi:hypothetical protein